MSDDDMAEAIAWSLSDGGRGPWRAEYDGLGEIVFHNEDGERFRITVVAEPEE